MITPIQEIATIMPWVGEVSPHFFYFTAVVDILGGLGVLLPALTRIQPHLTLLAAAGCVALQVAAAIFHLSRGEVTEIPFNILLMGLSLFLYWGRHSKAPITGKQGIDFTRH